MKDSLHILVVEDDKAIRNLISTALTAYDYLCTTASNGKEALQIAVINKPDVIILDLGLPDMDGVDLIRSIRGFSNCPIIVVSARTEDHDKIAALDEGADDYLTKPFSVEELLARLRVAIRRMKEQHESKEEEIIYQNGALKIDYSSCTVTVEGKEVHLTPMEYKLLCLLAENTGRVLTHNYILDHIWTNAMESDTPSLRVFMATLRKKIEKDTSHPQYIQTHVGIGYRMIRKETP